MPSHYLLYTSFASTALINAVVMQLNTIKQEAGIRMIYRMIIHEFF